MGGIFFVITTLFRTMFLLLAGASITVITATRMAEANKLPFDPFTPYADIMPGQSWNDVEARGLRCNRTLATYNVGARCSMPLPNGAISEINVEFSQSSSQLTYTSFTLREKLTLGHLILLWGKPEIEIYGELAFLNWPHSHISAIAQIYNRHISYWLPIIDVSFDFAD